MKEVTLDELIAEVQTAEAKMHESSDTAAMIKNVAEGVSNAAFYNDKIKILTDYDADGICSAYIMEKLINTIAPDCDVTVECNDRRRAYGLDPNIKGEEDTQYIILDMGSNQLDLAKRELGENVIIIDHHLIEDKAVRDEFISSPNLCNPHALNADDSLNAQYCATGLAYRVFQEVKEKYEKNNGKENTEKLFNDKLENTLAIVACIGTATDMVNVLDTNSYNRNILKDGLARIDNADEQNLDFNIGYMLALNKTADGVTAHQLAFNTGAYLNAPSRMSASLGENGAQLIYNALTGEEGSITSLLKLDKLKDVNDDRKAAIKQIAMSESYQSFVQEQRYGENADKNIAVYQLPDETPTALAGLVASKLTEATDKAIICLSYHEKTGGYSGSARNATTNETSLKAVVDFAMNAEDRSPDFIANYGGHEDAMGVSFISDIKEFTRLIDNASEAMQAKPLDDRIVLKINTADLTSDETFQKLRQLEPTGIGLKLPQVHIEGSEQYRDKNFVSGRSDWKRVKVKSGKTTIQVNDWAYDAKEYPQDDKNGISFLAELSINDYGGQHTELQTVHDRAFLKERTAELEKSTGKQLGNTDVAKD